MENKLEQLLNSLIEKGWKPRNCNYQKYEDGCLIYEKMGDNGVYSIGQYPVSLREITSIESGLWQFVCENGMVDRYKYDSKTYEVRIENWIKRREIGPEGEVSINNSWRGRGSAEYRLIESALCDEDKLEEFLLSNIKAEG